MEIDEICAEEAKDRIKNNRNIVILDVRTPEEFEEEHLPHAVNINIYADDFEERISRLERTKTYLVHCKSGGRSRAAVELMLELGFTDVTNVVGWMF
ncbi:rhodanese-like domain-containing protein [Candidatus Woesearchaeota archaeon]|nr:rhodanese-like domain-containing protein [Candidatus Woesearchaeota archaeon]